LYMYATVDLANSRPLLPLAATGRTALQTAGSKLPTLMLPVRARARAGPLRPRKELDRSNGRERSHSKPSSTPATGNLSAPWQRPPRGGPAGPGRVYRNIRMQLCPSQPSHPPAAQASGPRAGQAATGPDRVTSITGCDSAQSRAAGTTFGRGPHKGNAGRSDKHAGPGRATSIAGCNSSRPPHTSGQTNAHGPRQRHRRSSPPIGAAGIVGIAAANK
jgi:hypothetical protein